MTTEDEEIGIPANPVLTDLRRCMEQVALTHERIDELKQAMLLKGAYNLPKLVETISELKAEVDAIWKRLEIGKVHQKPDTIAKEDVALITETAILAARLAMTLALKQPDEDTDYVAKELEDLVVRLEKLNGANSG